MVHRTVVSRARKTGDVSTALSRARRVDRPQRQTPTLSLFADGTEAVRVPGFQTPAQIARAVQAHFAQAPA